jgi:hypothetical protein
VFDRLTRDGVAWDATADFPARSMAADAVLWATGFRAALDHLAPLHLRAPGGGIVMDGTRVVAEPRLHLVGYGPSASTIGASRAGPPGGPGAAAHPRRGRRGLSSVPSVRVT